MNIVHLTTFHHGGAGNAALQLHKALLNAGEKSSIIYVQSLNGKTELPGSYSISNQKLLDRLITKLKRIINYRIRKEFNNIKKIIIAENMALPFSEYNLLRHPIVKNADIIHLHWIAGMVNYPDFFKRCRKKIVWTLHDMNPISGIFFYEEDKKNNKIKAGRLDARVFDIKKKAINSMKTGMDITTPSHWLMTEVKKSKLFEKFNCHTISYIVDLKNFAIRDKKACREELGISQTAIIFLFTAMSVATKRKGFDLLIDAFKKIGHLESLTEIIAIGNMDSSLINDLPIKFIGEIKDKAILAKYYSAADAFILPSREDNLPNVMLEAFACGLPVIGFPIGGIKENVIDGKTGYLAEEISGEALAKIIRKVIENPRLFSPYIIRNFAEQNFSEEKIVLRFQHLYHDILNDTNTF